MRSTISARGATMDKWTPTAEGNTFAFPEILSPLEEYRDRVTVVSNLAHPMAGGVGSDAGGDHARSAAVFLSGAHPEKGRTHGGTTVDQIAAQHIGPDTPLPSIELAIEEVGLNCGGGYGCAYYNTIAWRTPRCLRSARSAHPRRNRRQSSLRAA